MPRPEQPLDRDGSPVKELAHWLRDLRATAALTYVELAKRSGYSVSTLQEAAAGRRLPTQAVTLAFAGACNADVEAWRAYWVEVRRAVDGTPQNGGISLIPPWATSSAVLESQKTEPAEQAPMPVAVKTGMSLDHVASNMRGTASLDHEVKNRARPWWMRHHWRLSVAALAVVAAVVASVLLAMSHHKAPRAFASVVVQNKVAFGPNKLVEDTTPVYLSTETISRCGARGCKLPDTDMWSGAKLVVTCWTRGEQLTNADETSSGIDRNKSAVQSDLWYQAMWKDGRRGYISEVYVAPKYRGSLNLKRC